MVPVTLAKSVSSLPRPTLAPGLMRVPRWRTMMVPPGTSWPPKAFTPRRCALESRPFLELPKPFLCAITNPCLFFHGLNAHYFFLPLAAFLAALFLAAFGLVFDPDLPLADFAGAASPSAAAGFAFFGLGAGRSGAVKRSPSKAISVILTAVNGWR